MATLIRHTDNIKYVLVRSKKITGMKITVDAERGTVVTVPVNCSTRIIKALIRNKASWIKQRLENLEMQVGCPVPRKFVGGDKFFYLGERYSLNVEKSSVGTAVRLGDGKICVALGSDKKDEKSNAVRDAMEKWYRNQAYWLINSRVEKYAGFTGLKPSGVKIKKQRCRWGSCSAKGNLNFNWKLVMAPLEVIDYVVVHELCHLVRLDHSAEFWRQVAQVLPDYQEKRRWLKRLGPVLSF